MWIFSRKKIRDKKAPSSTARGGIKKTAKVDSEIKAKAAEVKSMKDLYSSAEQAKTKEEKGPGKKIFKYQQAPKILVRPLVTEKVSNLGADNKYVFAVAVRANKVEVAKAIQQVYGIKPIKVNIINMAGKKARYGRITGRRKDWKKAIVTLAAGQTIKVYEGV